MHKTMNSLNLKKITMLDAYSMTVRMYVIMLYTYVSTANKNYGHLFSVNDYLPQGLFFYVITYVCTKLKSFKSLIKP